MCAKEETLRAQPVFKIPEHRHIPALRSDSPSTLCVSGRYDEEFVVCSRLSKDPHPNLIKSPVLDPVLGLKCARAGGLP